MAKVTTSIRLDAELRRDLAKDAARQGLTLTELMERYLQEGLATARYPGIVYRGGPSGRRAALAGGPDVWEVVSALRELTGSEADRIRTVADQLELHQREISLALDYAAAHPDEIEGRIRLNDDALDEAERIAAERSRLLA